jgi:hypothetical protein
MVHRAFERGLEIVNFIMCWPNRKGTLFRRNFCSGSSESLVDSATKTLRRQPVVENTRSLKEYSVADPISLRDRIALCIRVRVDVVPSPFMDDAIIVAKRPDNGQVLAHRSQLGMPVLAPGAARSLETRGHYRLRSITILATALQDLEPERCGELGLGPAPAETADSSAPLSVPPLLVAPTGAPVSARVFVCDVAHCDAVAH